MQRVRSFSRAAAAVAALAIAIAAQQPQQAKPIPGYPGQQSVCEGKPLRQMAMLTVDGNRTAETVGFFTHGSAVVAIGTLQSLRRTARGLGTVEGHATLQPSEVLKGQNLVPASPAPLDFEFRGGIALDPATGNCEQDPDFGRLLVLGVTYVAFFRWDANAKLAFATAEDWFIVLPNGAALPLEEWRRKYAKHLKHLTVADVLNQINAALQGGPQ